MNETQQRELGLSSWPDAYRELCATYRAIDDFRARMLALLPLASGGAIFLLTASDAALKDPGVLLPIGLFGFFVTAGLLAYEIFGVRRCHALILAGAQIEIGMGVQGQFVTRPAAVAGIVSEPFAAAVIYPAVLGAWAYVAVAPNYSQWCTPAAALVFSAFTAAILIWSLWLRSHGRLRETAAAANLSIERFAASD